MAAEKKAAAAAKKTPEKKAPVKKAAAKTTAKKTTKKTEPKVKVTLEFQGNSFTTDDLIKNAKNVYHYDMKKKVSDIETLELYAKPEESRVYFVVNGKDFGSYQL